MAASVQGTMKRMNTSNHIFPPQHHLPLDLSRKARWAGLLSLVTHLFILVMGVWLVRGVMPRTAREAERSVWIVLTPATNATQSSYYSAEFVNEDSQSLNSVTPQDGDHTTQALPTGSQIPAAIETLSLPSPTRSSLALPGVEVAGNGLNAAPGRPILEPYGELVDVLAAEAERTKNKTPLGPTTTLSVFGSPAATGRSFVFVLDRSQSMGDDGLGVLSAAEKELLIAVRGLQANHRFQIIAYNDKLKYCSQRGLLSATPESFQAVQDYFQTLAAHGPTDHLAGLMAALRLQPDVIFLLTDGGDPYLGIKQREHVAATAGKTQIHCLQFGWRKPVDETSREGLEKLANERGGTYTFIDMSVRK